ncbi:MAG: DUF1489 domain-containing protein [Thalassobaculum sp.]|uniref:DUF1489 family protein n=1 Tax=Thalassobaculum sp. TaxID=2022740 RepID=UPI0032ED1FAA
MPLNLIKLCVGIETVEQLERYRRQRRAELAAAGLPPFDRHLTRNFPRRADEILGTGGSLYWVIKREVRVRQRLHAIEEAVDHEGRPCCALVFENELVRVMPRSQRPFQGWRYLEGADAPADLPAHAVDESAEMPEDMRRELRSLGLL